MPAVLFRISSLGLLQQLLHFFFQLLLFASANLPRSLAHRLSPLAANSLSMAT
jgi:hypothetical protein